MRLVAVVVVALAGVLFAAAPPVGPGEFNAEQKAWLAAVVGQIDAHARAGRFAEAAALYAQESELRKRVRGPDDWRARDTEIFRVRLARLTKLPQKDREALGRSVALLDESKRLRGLGKYRDSEKLARQALEICTDVLGEKHAEVAAALDSVAASVQRRGDPVAALDLFRKALAIRRADLGEADAHVAFSLLHVAACLQQMGKTSDALPHYHNSIKIAIAALGEDHPNTAMVYCNLGTCLHAQGKSPEALRALNKALAISRKALGDDDLQTADCYLCLGTCLQGSGRLPEALAVYDKALIVREKALGPNSIQAATVANNLATALELQGKHAEALVMSARVLRIMSATFGENSASTATVYNNVAASLRAQQRQAEAMPLYQKAVAIFEKTLPKGHPTLAIVNNNAALCLHELGNDKQALPMLQKALEIRIAANGETHPATANSHNNLGLCLAALSRHDEARKQHEKALAIRIDRLGKDHPETATSYINVAACLDRQGKHAEAESMLRQALKVRTAALGAEHPDTIVSAHNLAFNLWEQGRHAEAALLWQQALPAHEVVRLHLARGGFERAQALSGRLTVPKALALALAKLGQPRNAFRHAEASLARGLLDDLTDFDDKDMAQLLALQARLKALDATVASLAGEKQRGRREAVLEQSRQTSARISRLLRAWSARQLTSTERIQKSIPADAALVTWLDSESLGEYWACVLCHEGKPVWARCPGTGSGGAWTKKDQSLYARLLAALRDPASDKNERERLTHEFRDQRFKPMMAALKGVKRLYVVPNDKMAYVPVEVLTNDYQISYVPSGSVLVRLAERHRSLGASPMLALGDPIFDRPEPPEKGLLVKAVKPGSAAALAGLNAGDVLLSVGKKAVGSAKDVVEAVELAPVQVRYWRDGKTLSGELAKASLGAEFDDRPPREAVRAWRERASPGMPANTGHKRLPGTRLEVESITALTSDSVKLLGSDASEQKLDELRAKLKTFRVLHFATHGEVDRWTPVRSALILAQDGLPDPTTQARQGKKVYDGRLTVAAIRTWQLDADLVVLSACETGLGRQGGGEGLLGFAQALLSRGARAVVLSRWPVDDVATSLLMHRFYQNLLGKRSGLSQPMGRAAALQEAKQWFRGLSVKDAQQAAESLPRGKLVAAPKTQAKTYAHPHYWAAFTLVGDPD